MDTSDSRPRLEPIEDELDMFGRPKRQILRMPTDVLPEGVEAEKMPFAGLILAAEGETEAAVPEGVAKPPGASAAPSAAGQR